MKRYNKNAILLDEDTINGYNNEDLKSEKKYEAFEKYIYDIDYEMKNKRVDDFICYACENQSLTKHLSVYYTTELEELYLDDMLFNDVSDVFYEDGDLKTQFELNIIRPIYENDLREILYNNKSFELLVLDVYDDLLVSGWESYFDLKAEDSLRDEWENLTDNEAWEKLLEEAIEEHIEYEIRSLKKTLGFQTIDNELQFEIFDKLPKVWNIVYGSAEDSLRDEWKNLTDNEAWERKLEEAKADLELFKGIFGEKAFNDFTKYKQRIKNAGIPTDYVWHTKHTNKQDMERMLYNIARGRPIDAETAQNVNEKGHSTTEAFNKTVRGDFEYLGNSGGYDIYWVKNHEAAIDLGVNAGWCTSGRYGGGAGNPSFIPNEGSARKHFNELVINDKFAHLYHYLDPKTHYAKYALVVYDTSPIDATGKFQGIKGYEDVVSVRTNCEVYNYRDNLAFDVLDELPVDLLLLKPRVSFIRQSDFNEDGLCIEGETLIKANPKSIIKTIFNEDIKFIGEGAFSDCYNLEQVSLPNAKEIGKCAFAFCKSLEQVSLPNAEKIGYGAFAFCKSLEQVSLPNAEKIGYGAFDGCESLEQVSLLNAKEIGEGAFYNCKNLKEVSLPNAEKIGEGAFYSCESLEKIYTLSVNTVVIDYFRGLEVIFIDGKEERKLEEAKADLELFKGIFGEKAFNDFTKYKQRIKNAGISTDYVWHTKHTSKQDMERILYNIARGRSVDAETVQKVNEEGHSTTDEFNKTVRGDFEYLGNSSGYDIYWVKDHKAAIDLGVNSGWCTSGRYGGGAGNPSFIPDEDSARTHFGELANNDAFAHLYHYLDPKTHYAKYALVVYDTSPVDMTKHFRDIKGYEDVVSVKTNCEVYDYRDNLAFDVLDELPVDLLLLKPRVSFIRQSDFNEDGLFIDGETLIKVNPTIDIETIFNEDIKFIGNYAFYGCRSLKEVSLPNAEKIGEEVFSGCRSLEKVSLLNVKEIGGWVFLGCNSLKEVSLPNAEKIGEYTFYGCANLKEVSLPNAKEIGDYTFRGCYNLDQVSLPNAKEIGKEAFYNCYRLMQVSLPNVEKIGEETFRGCRSLEQVSLPNVKEIGVRAFYGCINLKEVSLPNVEKIGIEAFSGCRGLEQVSLPNAKEIGNGAFLGCRGLEQVSLPNVKEIGEDAFYGCKNLEQVSLPNVKEIGEGAFFGCRGLEKIYTLSGNTVVIDYFRDEKIIFIDGKEERKLEEAIEEHSVEDYAEDVWAMNEVLTYMNNEEAYYGTGWLYLYADGCSYGELKNYLSGEYGEPDELYQEYVDEFEYIYNYYHEDGLYDAPRKVEEYANTWDKKLGLEPIENIKRIKLNR